MDSLWGRSSATSLLLSLTMTMTPMMMMMMMMMVMMMIIHFLKTIVIIPVLRLIVKLDVIAVALGIHFASSD